MPPADSSKRPSQRRKRSDTAMTSATTTTTTVTAAAVGCWEDIPVTLGGDGDGEGEMDMYIDMDTDGQEDDNSKAKKKKNTKNAKRNHYDNEKLGKQATMDLPAQPGEDIGMMYGGSIQVLRGDQYQVILEHDHDNNSNDTIQRRIVLLKPNAEEQDYTQKEAEALAATANPTNNKKKTKKTKEPKVDPTKEKSAVPALSKVSKKQPAQQESSHVPPTQPIQDVSSSLSPKTTDTLTKEQKHSSHQDEIEDENEDGWRQLQLSWSHASGGAVLDPILCRSLLRLGFDQPTPIQAATLSATILGRRNLVGAAPTGSGKTLAFLLPILQSLLQGQPSPQQRSVVRALIVTPTRELATQISSECDKLLPATNTTNKNNNANMKKQSVTLVGGIAPVKQARLLSTLRPPIIVGTPGRLWQMISSQEHDHLKDLSQIQFLVLDEADRMTQDHSFPQLIQILERIHQENKGTDYDEDEDSTYESSEEDDDDDKRLLGLPGIRGEAKTAMLTPELLEQIQKQREAMEPEQKEVNDDEFQGIDDSTEPEDDNAYDEVFHLHNGDDDDNGLSDARPAVHRQTFIYSATLTLPYTSTKSSAVSNKKKKSSRARKLPLDGGLAEILEKTYAMGETKVVDLSSSRVIEAVRGKASASSTPSSMGVKLPPGLKLEHIKCTQLHKDSHLYAYLMTTAQGASGPALVFCNSIAAVRRVGTTLQSLGLSVRVLHAHMQQRARFKAVECLSKDNTSNGSRMVVVCTDVAARGLDIPSVSTVIHYDVARAVDTFVHRAGRTARGMGAGAVGASLSLIAAAEDRAHSKIVLALDVPFHKVLMDGRLLASSQERVNLACKVVMAAEKMKKMQFQNAWFLEKAKEADLELDDDLLEDSKDLSAVEQGELREAARARDRLAHLLAQPMTTQRFGKFMSTNSAAMQEEIKPLLVSSKATTASKNPKKKKPRLA